MLSKLAKKKIRDADRINKLWWIANVLASVLIVYFIIHDASDTPGVLSSLGSQFVTSLYVIAVGLGILSIGLKYYFLSDKKIEEYIANAKESPEGKIDYEQLEALKQMSSYEKRIVALPRLVLNSFMFIWVINIIVIFLGLAIFGSTKSFAIIIEAIFLDIIAFPRTQKIVEKAIKKKQ